MVSVLKHWYNSVLRIYCTFMFCSSHYAVVTVRFVQTDYIVSRGAGSVTVCLTKDLQTASSLSITIFTEDGTAQSV